jgi:hypothetical protein
MANDETNQLLRDILAAQKEQFEHLRHQGELYADQCKRYDSTSGLYKKSLELRPWIFTFQVMKDLAFVTILGYLVFHR